MKTEDAYAKRELILTLIRDISFVIVEILDTINKLTEKKTDEVEVSFDEVKE